MNVLEFRQPRAGVKHSPPAICFRANYRSNATGAPVANSPFCLKYGEMQPRAAKNVVYFRPTKRRELPGFRPLHGPVVGHQRCGRKVDSTDMLYHAGRWGRGHAPVALSLAAKRSGAP